MATDKLKDALQDDPTIAEYQARREEFQPRWNRTFLFLCFPAFALFALGESYFHQRWMVWIGVPLFMIGLARAAWLWYQYKRCPRCDALQRGGLRYPFLKCGSCGARLSVGPKDSW